MRNNSPTCGQRGDKPAYKHNCLMYQQLRLLVSVPMGFTGSLGLRIMEHYSL